MASPAYAVQRAPPTNRPTNRPTNPCPLAPRQPLRHPGWPGAQDILWANRGRLAVPLSFEFLSFPVFSFLLGAFRFAAFSALHSRQRLPGHGAGRFSGKCWVWCPLEQSSNTFLNTLRMQTCKENLQRDRFLLPLPDGSALPWAWPSFVSRHLPARNKLLPPCPCAPSMKMAPNFAG